MWLKNHWYAVLDSKELKQRPVKAERLGELLVFWRDSQGKAHVQQDRCPHLGASLSQGHVEAHCLVCPFHGFAFDGEGQCQRIPANGPQGRVPPQLTLHTYPSQEKHGLVWIWYGDAPPTPEPPFFEELKSLHYGTLTDQWPVHISRAIENQLDSAHLPFVHHNTIGRRLSPFMQGPYVEADAAGIQVWNFQHLDADKQLSQQELKGHIKGRAPALVLLFPGIWRVNTPATKRLAAL